MSGFRVGQGRAAALLVALAVALSGCAGSTDGEASDSPAVASQWPAAKVSTPLEARKALEDMDVFGECLDAKKAETGDYAFYIVECVMVSFKDTDGGGRSVYADRGVLVLMFDPGVWPPKEWLCGGLPPERTVVTDDKTFVAVGVPYRGESGGDWPPEVWPADVAAALGGKPVTIADFGCPG